MKTGLVLLLTLLVLNPAFGQRQRMAKPEPTHANVAYGDHPQQVIDFWQAETGARGPLAIYIHGGGFTGGSKNGISAEILKGLLDSGIHVASVEYRLVKHAPLPAAHQDAVRAIQFIRSKAKQWAIATDLIGAFGGSAGAQLCAYLAFRDDMADPSSKDPIARQSTRLACVAPLSGQSTMDLDWWLANIPGYREKHKDMPEIFGMKGLELAEAIREVSIINHITPDDPPVYMTYRMAPDEPVPADAGKARGWSIHHVNFGTAMQQKLQLAGVEVTLDYPGPKTRYESVVEFFVDKLAWKGDRALYRDFEPGVFTGKGGESIDYQLLKPRNFDPSKRYPLVVFLHGSGGRGPANIRNLIDADAPAHLATDAVAGQHEAFYLVPQAPGPNTWAVAISEITRRSERISKQAVLLELVDDVIANQRIDRRRLYVTGLSMGGFGTFSAVRARPDFWAAAAPVCGGWDPAEGALFTKTPMWLFHGDKDSAVEVALSRDMNQAIAAAGGDVRYTEYPGVGHNSWLKA